MCVCEGMCSKLKTSNDFIMAVIRRFSQLGFTFILVSQKLSIISLFQNGIIKQQNSFEVFTGNYSSLKVWKFGFTTSVVNVIASDH